MLTPQDGPIVLAGHPCGGVVIMKAGDDPKVSALINVAALAPGASEGSEGLAKRLPMSPDTLTTDLLKTPLSRSIST